MTYNGELVQMLIDQNFESRTHAKAADLVLAFTAGSHQHGAKLETSDIDVAGIYIGDPVKELAIGNEDPRRKGHFTAGSADQYEKNKAGDLDAKVYTLRRWAGLAMKGNPNVLSYLFVPQEITDESLIKKHSWCCPHDEQQCEYPNCIGDNPAYTDSRCVKRKKFSGNVWREFILPNVQLFQASGHATAFLGLGASQYHRMFTGDRGRGKHGQRPELEAQFGYDSKAAMHMIRGMTECLEFLNTGFMTFPRPERLMLIDIRLGKYSLTQIEQMYKELEAEVKAAEKTSPLPPECDREAVSKLVVEAILSHWGRRGLLG